MVSLTSSQIALKYRDPGSIWWQKVDFLLVIVQISKATIWHQFGVVYHDPIP